jgi:hypothetical protein
MSITSSAVLVELNIALWSANKLDRDVTDQVTADAAATRSAAKVHKNLMAGTNLRKEIADFAQSCRNWHNTCTLPWADRGARLIPTSLFMEYKTEANARRDKFNSMVQRFLDQYDSLVQQSAVNLGALFKASDYPSVDELRGKFGFRLVFSPVPEAGDFRIDVANNEMVELRNQYESAFTERLADAMKEPWDRLYKTLNVMSEKLTDDETSEVKKRYHDSFVTNAQSLCSMLTHLNITNDPKLEQARRDLERVMIGADIEDIKDSPAVRADMKSSIDKILSTYEW